MSMNFVLLMSRLLLVQVFREVRAVASCFKEDYLQRHISLKDRESKMTKSTLKVFCIESRIVAGAAILWYRVLSRGRSSSCLVGSPEHRKQQQLSGVSSSVLIFVFPLLLLWGSGDDDNRCKRKYVSATLILIIALLAPLISKKEVFAYQDKLSILKDDCLATV